MQGEHGEALHYVLLAEEGPDHDKSFRVQAKIGERTIGEGVGHNKKAAEQAVRISSILCF